MSGIALITGVSRGIGLSAAAIMLEQGWKVIGTSKSSPFPEQLKAHHNFHGIHVDLGDSKSIKQLKNIISENGIDVLVNNAGIFEPVLFSASDDIWNTHWDEMLTVNLKSPANLSKWAVNYWQKTGNSGIIINVSSRASYRGETAEYSSYAASKAALTALTKTLARGFGKDSIYAYTIAPGFVDTDMAAGSIDVYGKDYLVKDLVLDEIVPPNEVGELIAVLASGKFKHMTGQTFHINSGSYFI
jgi:3-oxoacyl-[acyl-carrier protein] reductase